VSNVKKIIFISSPGTKDLFKILSSLCVSLHPLAFHISGLFL
jgi:hypothetical protein